MKNIPTMSNGSTEFGNTKKAVLMVYSWEVVTQIPLPEKSLVKMSSSKLWVFFMGELLQNERFVQQFLKQKHTSS